VAFSAWLKDHGAPPRLIRVLESQSARPHLLQSAGRKDFRAHFPDEDQTGGGLTHSHLAMYYAGPCGMIGTMGYFERWPTLRAEAFLCGCSNAN
jgi:hypothetical protein